MSFEYNEAKSRLKVAAAAETDAPVVKVAVFPIPVLVAGQTTAEYRCIAATTYGPEISAAIENPFLEVPRQIVCPIAYAPFHEAAGQCFRLNTRLLVIRVVGLSIAQKTTKTISVRIKQVLCASTGTGKLIAGTEARTRCGARVYRFVPCGIIPWKHPRSRACPGLDKRLYSIIWIGIESSAVRRGPGTTGLVGENLNIVDGDNGIIEVLVNKAITILINGIAPRVHICLRVDDRCITDRSVSIGAAGHNTVATTDTLAGRTGPWCLAISQEQFVDEVFVGSTITVIVHTIASSSLIGSLIIERVNTPEAIGAIAHRVMGSFNTSLLCDSVIDQSIGRRYAGQTRMNLLAIGIDCTGHFYGDCWHANSPIITHFVVCAALFGDTIKSTCTLDAALNGRCLHAHRLVNYSITIVIETVAEFACRGSNPLCTPILAAVGHVRIQVMKILVTPFDGARPGHTPTQAIRDGIAACLTRATILRVGLDVKVFIDVSIAVIVYVVTEFLTPRCDDAIGLASVGRLSVVVYKTWVTRGDNTLSNLACKSGIGTSTRAIASATVVRVCEYLNTHVLFFINRAIAVVIASIAHLGLLNALSLIISTAVEFDSKVRKAYVGNAWQLIASTGEHWANGQPHHEMIVETCFQPICLRCHCIHALIVCCQGPDNQELRSSICNCLLCSTILSDHRAADAEGSHVH